MCAKSMFGKKMQRKSWDSSEIDREWEDKKIGLVFLVVIVVMMLIALLMWWIKQSLN